MTFRLQAIQKQTVDYMHSSYGLWLTNPSVIYSLFLLLSTFGFE